MSLAEMAQLAVEYACLGRFATRPALYLPPVRLAVIAVLLACRFLHSAQLDTFATLLAQCLFLVYARATHSAWPERLLALLATGVFSHCLARLCALSAWLTRAAVCIDGAHVDICLSPQSWLCCDCFLMRVAQYN